MPVTNPTAPARKPPSPPEAAPITTAILATLLGPLGPPPSPELGPWPGDVLDGKYRLLRMLGQGGMGVVFLAWDQISRRPVAIKLLRANPAQAAAYWKCLQAEASALARLRHPNVITAFELSPGPQRPYLALEWLEGGSVADLLRRQGALSPLLATQIAAAVARALGAVHRAGLVHRDVKPDNLLLSATGAVKLADFGLAVELRRGRTRIDSGWGTPPYFSPEQAWNEPLDHRSDLYSLGATYYELLTGHKPFQADTVLEYALRHREGPVPDPRTAAPGVPAACATVVQKAMAKDAAERYADAGEMLAALELALAHLEGGPRP